MVNHLDKQRRKAKNCKVVKNKQKKRLLAQLESAEVVGP
jgi:hypothetical protein